MNPAQAKIDEERLRVGLEEKRRDAEAKALDVQQKAGAMRSRYEEMLRQEERDNDQEFSLQREAQQRALTQEREVAQTLKGEAAILRKKFEAFQTEMEARASVGSPAAPPPPRRAAAAAAAATATAAAAAAAAATAEQSSRSSREERRKPRDQPLTRHAPRDPCPPPPAPLRQDMRNTLRAREREIKTLQREAGEREKAMGLLRKDIREREESVTLPP